MRYCHCQMFDTIELEYNLMVYYEKVHIIV